MIDAWLIVGSTEVGNTEVGSTEVGNAEAGNTEVGNTEAGSTEVGIFWNVLDQEENYLQDGARVLLFFL